MSSYNVGNKFDLKHGMFGTPEYRAYFNARDRCDNQNNKHNWKHYGGRGIRFLFTSFKQFFAELGLKPTPEHSLDRIDNDGNYEPGNVRWAMKDEQLANRRSYKKRGAQ